MPILSVVISTIVILIGLRLVLTAIQAGFTGKVLVRHGLRSQWQLTRNRNDAWRVAARDGLMGVLLIVLGVVLLF